MGYVDFDSLAQKLTPTLQVLEGKRKELLKKGCSEGARYAHSRQAKPIYIEIKLKIFRLELFLPHSFWEQGLISYFSA